MTQRYDAIYYGSPHCLVVSSVGECYGVRKATVRSEFLEDYHRRKRRDLTQPIHKLFCALIVEASEDFVRFPAAVIKFTHMERALV